MERMGRLRTMARMQKLARVSKKCPALSRVRPKKPVLPAFFLICLASRTDDLIIY